jgi:hypothetical protein
MDLGESQDCAFQSLTYMDSFIDTRAEMICPIDDTIHIAILVAQFNTFNMIHIYNKKLYTGQVLQLKKHLKEQNVSNLTTV